MAFALQIRNNASQDRLKKLIEELLQPEANKAEIDRRIWDLFGEEWAIMFTDLAGFSQRVKDKEDTENILLCIGLGFGKVLRIGDDDVFGAEVNAASKLGEDAAKAGDILGTDPVRDAALELPYVTFTPIDDTPAGTSGAYKLHYAL